MSMLRVNGSAIRMKIRSDYFFDDFERDGPELGNGWVDLASVVPTGYDQIGIVDGYVTTRALSRSAVAGLPYAPNPGDDYDNYLDHPGTIVPGIAGAWQPDIGTSDVYVEILYGGFLDLPHHTEATPGVCFAPGTPETAFGGWMAEVGGPGNVVLVAGCVGNPPEDFVDFVVDAQTNMALTNGQQARIGFLTGNGGTEARMFLNRRQISFQTHGLDPLPIPPALQGSTIHGILQDQHMCYPPGDPVDLAFMQSAASVREVRIFTR